MYRLSNLINRIFSVAISRSDNLSLLLSLNNITTILHLLSLPRAYIAGFSNGKFDDLFIQEPMRNVRYKRLRNYVGVRFDFLVIDINLGTSIKL